MTPWFDPSLQTTILVGLAVELPLRSLLELLPAVTAAPAAPVTSPPLPVGAGRLAAAGAAVTTLQLRCNKRQQLRSPPLRLRQRLCLWTMSPELSNLFALLCLCEFDEWGQTRHACETVFPEEGAPPGSTAIINRAERLSRALVCPRAVRSRRGCNPSARGPDPNPTLVR